MIVLAILILASTPIALAATLNHKVTYEANASGPCFVMHYKADEYGQIEELYYANVSSGYITTVGEALAKGPIPYAIPGSDPFSYPIDPKTKTPIYPSAYPYDPGNVSGIGSTFANWTVNVDEKHKSILYLRPETKPLIGAPLPFAGVFYPEADSLWIPIHYEGFWEEYTQISGGGVFISLSAELGQPGMPEGLSMMGVSIFIDNKTFWLLWINQPMKLDLLNPMFPEEELPAAVVYKIRVELEKTQSSTYVYAGFVGFVGVAVMAVIGLAVTKRRKVNHIRV